MLSVTRLARINGHEPRIITGHVTGLHQAVCECSCSGETVRLYGAPSRSESRALESLRDNVLKEHGRIVMERAGWKCENCQGIKGLSAHHKVFRSHERSDAVDALEALCADCHAGKHGQNIHRVEFPKFGAGLNPTAGDTTATEVAGSEQSQAEARPDEEEAT